MAQRLGRVHTDNFSIYLASLAGDKDWLSEVLNGSESRGRDAHRAFVRVAIAWADKDAESVLRLTESAGLDPSVAGQTIHDPDRAWLALMRGIALDYLGDYTGAADAVRVLTPQCCASLIIQFPKEFGDRVCFLTKVAELNVKGGRFGEAMLWLRAVEWFLPKLGPSWSAQREAVKVLIDKCRAAHIEAPV